MGKGQYLSDVQKKVQRRKMDGVEIVERTGTRGPAPKEPSERVLKMLGKRPDGEIAKIAKIGRATVARWRTARGIRPFNRPWTPEEREATREGLRKLHKTAGVSLADAAKALEITYDVAHELSANNKVNGRHRPLRWKRTGRPERKETAKRARAAYGMRQNKPPLTFKEIGVILSCTPSEAERLSKRGKELQSPAA